MTIALIQTSTSAASNSFQHLVQITTYFQNFNILACETAEYYQYYFMEWESVTDKSDF